MNAVVTVPDERTLGAGPVATVHSGVFDDVPVVPQNALPPGTQCVALWAAGEHSSSDHPVQRRLHPVRPADRDPV